MSEVALLRLGAATAEAVKGALAVFVGDAVDHGQPAVAIEGVSPLDSIVVPAVLTNVSYVEGVRGGNVFTISSLGARRLAAVMSGAEPVEEDDTELTELEVSSVGEAMNQMMTAAAGATAVVLGQEVEISAPQTRLITTPDAAADAFDGTSLAVTTAFTVCGEPAQLIQVVPNAFIVRMTEAYANLDAASGDPRSGAGPDQAVSGDALHGVALRLSAELGTFTMGIARAIALNPGSVVELTAEADAPVDLYVNGRPYGTAHLVVNEEGEWAVRLERVFALESPSPVGS